MSRTAKRWRGSAGKSQVGWGRGITILAVGLLLLAAGLFAAGGDREVGVVQVTSDLPLFAWGLLVVGVLTLVVGVGMWADGHAKARRARRS